MLAFPLFGLLWRVTGVVTLLLKMTTSEVNSIVFWVTWNTDAVLLSIPSIFTGFWAMRCRNNYGLLNLCFRIVVRCLCNGFIISFGLGRVIDVNIVFLFLSFCWRLGGASSGRLVGMSSVESILNCRRKYVINLAFCL